MPPLMGEYFTKKSESRASKINHLLFFNPKSFKCIFTGFVIGQLHQGFNKLNEQFKPNRRGKIRQEQPFTYSSKKQFKFRSFKQF